MDIVDEKRKCIIEGCNNVGEWKEIERGKVYRLRLCASHRHHLKKNNADARTYAKEKYKEIKCGKCEYCEWEGPCDIHRPNKGRYTNGNMRSTCPNCHRLISRGLIVDKYKTE